MIKIFEAVPATDLILGMKVNFVKRDWEVLNIAGTMPGNVAVELRALDNGDTFITYK